VTRRRRQSRKIEQVFFCASHTHSGPVISDIYPEANLPAWQTTALEKIGAALEEAAGRMAPARIGTGFGKAYIGHNRRLANPDGTVKVLWRNVEKTRTSPVDPTVGVIRVDAANGDPIAILVNYAYFPTIRAAAEGDTGLIQLRLWLRSAQEKECSIVPSSRFIGCWESSRTCLHYSVRESTHLALRFSHQHMKARSPALRGCSSVVGPVSDPAPRAGLQCPASECSRRASESQALVRNPGDANHGRRPATDSLPLVPPNKMSYDAAGIEGRAKRDMSLFRLYTSRKREACRLRAAGFRSDDRLAGYTASLI